MSFLRNLPVLWKILGLVALVLAGGGILVGTALVSLKQIGQAESRLTLAVEASFNAGRASANLLQWVRMVEFLPTEISDDQRKSFAAIASDERKRLQARLDNLSKLLQTATARETLAKFQQAVVAYDAVHKATAEMAEKKDYAGGAALVAGKFDDVDAMRKTLRDAEDFFNKQRVTEAERVDDEIESAIVLLLTELAAVAAVVVLLALAISILGISRPLRTAIDGMNRLREGDTGFQVDTRNRKDEVGQILTALVTFRQNAIDKTEAERRADAERTRSETERMAREEKERAAIAEISGLCDRIGMGDLEKRIDEQGKDGFLLSISQRLNSVTAMLQAMSGEMAEVAGSMANGDLTKRVDGAYEGVFGELKNSVNAMAIKLRELAGKLNESARLVKDASSEISTGSQDLAQRTESQAASIEETAASMHEITVTVKQNADNAQAANQLATAARDAADRGGQVMSNVVTSMTSIEASAAKISDIVSLIDEIAFQTNLLALNASVEAARAGESGKGFAVVAQEVRGLAQRSANASKDIKALIAESNGQVKTGAGLVNQAGTSLHEIVESVKKVTDIVAEIAAASREQASGLEQINTAVGQMDEMTQRNGALVEETSAAAQSLSEQASELSQQVAFFRT